MQLLLRKCGWDLDLVPLLGVGIDRQPIREMLRLSPGQRAAHGADVARMPRIHPTPEYELELLGALRDEQEGWPEE